MPWMTWDVPMLPPRRTNERQPYRGVRVRSFVRSCRAKYPAGWGAKTPARSVRTNDWHCKRWAFVRTVTRERDGTQVSTPFSAVGGVLTERGDE